MWLSSENVSLHGFPRDGRCTLLLLTCGLEDAEAPGIIEGEDTTTHMAKVRRCLVLRSISKSAFLSFAWSEDTV
jgi:hypothetical protein